MEKCFNCGAAVRSGAKFCTSCGTRLIDTPVPASGNQAWSVATDEDPSQVTTIEGQQAAPEQDPDSDEAAPFASWKHASSGWNATPSDSPADRFGAALDDNASSKDDEEDRFASWAAAYRTEDAADTSSTPAEPAGIDDDEIVNAESVTITPAVSREVDSADAGVGTGWQVPVTAGESAGSTERLVETRERASALLDELRSLVWSIGEATPAEAGDVTDLRNLLSNVRGQTPDFSDLEGTIAAVRESPKDIDALRELGNQAERLESLLQSHARLTSALDDAIRKMQ
jgi:hypothetical protein